AAAASSSSPSSGSSANRSAHARASALVTTGIRGPYHRGGAGTGASSNASPIPATARPATHDYPDAVAVVALAGGGGAAKFLRGLLATMPAGQVTVVGNTGDDAVFHGLHVSPDLDIVTYTLGGIVDTDKGWGVAGDPRHALDQLGRLGIDTWFWLGDQDFGTHIARTMWLAE